MIQKVLRIGSSVGVTIPKKALAPLHIKAGDKINVEIDEKHQSVVLMPIQKKVDKKLIEWTDKFIERYRPALEALAKK